MNVDMRNIEWETLLDAIYKINACDNTSDLIHTLLNVTRSIVPSYQIIFFRIKSEDGVFYSYDPEFIGSPPHFLEKYYSGIYDEDPLLRSLYLKNESYVFRDSDVINEDAKKNWPIYCDIYANEGIEYGLRAFLAYGEGIIGEVLLFRTKEEGDFSDFEKHEMEIFIRHASLCFSKFENNSDNANQKAVSELELISLYELTDRECEIAQLVADGITQYSIGSMLQISPSTVKKHVYNIYRKMNVHNRLQLRSKVMKK